MTSFPLYTDGTCEAVDAIPNGVLTYSVDKTDDFPSGTTAMYVCNDGYVLMNGNSVRVCQVETGSASGNFTGVEPDCIRKYLYNKMDSWDRGLRSEVYAT